MISKFFPVWITGMPRSGTSWFAQIFDSHPNVRFRLSPLFAYRFKNVLNDSSTPQQWSHFFEMVYEVHDEFMEQTDKKRDGRYPVFERKEYDPAILVIKSTRFHNLVTGALRKVGELKVLHIVRNPCGAINSWLKAPGEFPPDADVDENWRSGRVRKTGPEEFWGFDDWKRVTRMYLELQKVLPDKVRVVRYENLVDNPLATISTVFEWVGLKLDKQTLDFLSLSMSSHTEDQYAVYKDAAKVRIQWQSELPTRIIETIKNELSGTELEYFLRD